MSSQDAIAFKRLNELPDDDFIVMLADVFPGAPWVLEAVTTERPFSSVRALHGAMMQAIGEASDRLQMKLLERQTDSAADVEGDEETEKRILELARRYRSRFGFPYVVADPDDDAAKFADELERRLANEEQAERLVALCEIGETSRLRLEALLTHRNEEKTPADDSKDLPA